MASLGITIPASPIQSASLGMLVIDREYVQDPGEYDAGFAPGTVELLVTGMGCFHATSEGAVLDSVEFAAGEETKARVAFVSLPGDASIVSLPLDEASTLIIRGEPVGFGQVAWHGPGDRFHERITQRTKWGRIHLRREPLLGQAGPAKSVLHPIQRSAGIMNPSPAQIRDILAAFGAVFAAARRNRGGGRARVPPTLVVPTLMNGLARCVEHAPFTPSTAAKQSHHEIMLRFERLRPSWSERPTSIREICTALGVSERTLRTCCEEQVGVGPHRYMRLHRLRLVRRALLHSSPITASVASVARRYGFAELGRFAALYRVAFGELPSCTLAQGRPFSVAADPMETAAKAGN